MALPVGGAVVALKAAVLVVVMVDGFAVAGLDVVDADRVVEGAVAGLQADKGGHGQVVNKCRRTKTNTASICWQRSRHEM